MPAIDTLLNLVPDAPDTVLAHLRTHPQLALQKDSHGYSLLHAAASYEHAALATALVETFHLDPNVTDEDGETALFYAESTVMATELLRLGVRLEVENLDGLTAAGKLADEDEQPLVAAFLREREGERDAGAGDSALENGSAAAANTHTAITNNTAEGSDGGGSSSSGSSLPVPPPLPPGVSINLGTMMSDEAGETPDPEFRRRIEELAAREDFDSEATQRELRGLVADAVSGLTGAAADEDVPAAVRRRVE